MWKRPLNLITYFVGRTIFGRLAYTGYRSWYIENGVRQMKCNGFGIKLYKNWKFYDPSNTTNLKAQQRLITG